jgi:exopolyphosphatase/guanosine-5'-triphosphate,3'-diphosphate pyrophosphatase
MTVASIDLGTNSILLLIAEVNPETGKIKTLENLYRIPRIGKGLTPGNPIPEENIGRIFEVLNEYSEIIKKYSCEKVLATGTNAFRIASNKRELVNQIDEKFGFEVRIISGEEEALFSYSGVSNEYGENNLLVIDIGGGSTEIISGTGSNIYFRKSYSVGVVSLTEKFFQVNPPAKENLDNFIKHVQNVLEEVPDNIKKINTSIAIAGTPTTLACIKLNLKVYNEELIENSSLTNEELNNFVRELSKLTPEEIVINYSSVVKGREDVLLAGTIILAEIVKLLRLNEIKVSAKGIRYGAVVNWINSLKFSH